MEIVILTAIVSQGLPVFKFWANKYWLYTKYMHNHAPDRQAHNKHYYKRSLNICPLIYKEIQNAQPNHLLYLIYFNACFLFIIKQLYDIQQIIFITTQNII